jgi:uncharacterized protein (TIGR02246 family)
MFACNPDAPQAVSGSDAEAIQQLTERWIAAVKAKDIDRLLGLVTEDVIFLPPSGPPIKGKKAVGDLYQILFAQFDVEQSARTEEIEVRGDWAFAWGVEQFALSARGGGQPIHMSGKGLTILRRQPDGSWKFARGINNTSPEGASAD